VAEYKRLRASEGPTAGHTVGYRFVLDTFYTFTPGADALHGVMYGRTHFEARRGEAGSGRAINAVRLGGEVLLTVMTGGGKAPSGAVAARQRVQPLPEAGAPVPDSEIIVLGSNNKPGNFILRTGVDDKAISGVTAPGKSATVATDLTPETEIMNMFGRAPKRGDTLSGAFVEDVRAAGFDVVYAPTAGNPLHVRIVAGQRGFDETGREWLSAAVDRIARVRK
jgi:hypothetical protein